MKIKDLTLLYLPYDYNALEPSISKTIMKLHYTKHYGGYLAKLQAAVADFPDVANNELEDVLVNLQNVPQSIRTVVQNNGGGFYNHTLFFNTLGTAGKPQPTKLANLIKENFVDKGQDFIKEFTNAALSVFGSGWAWLVQEANGNLQITTTPNQDNPLMSHSKVVGKPIIGLDVWEHAYYIDYQSDRAQYIQNLLKVINWEKAEQNLI